MDDTIRKNKGRKSHAREDAKSEYERDRKMEIYIDIDMGGEKEEEKREG